MAEVNFRCGQCKTCWAGVPTRIDDAPDQPWHPWRYLGTCPNCHALAEQASWEANLLKAHSVATGPRTPEGKAASSANLAGHPTPEETRRTRFNALKHGLAAKVATFWPARPGQYAQCSGCDHLNSQDCRRWGGCLTRAELFMRVHMAFEAGDPQLMQELHANTQAGLHALLQDMILSIAQDGGPRVRTPEWYNDAEGRFHLARYTDEETGERVQIYRLEAHPLLKPLIDYIAKNRSTLADMEMTPRQQTEERQLEGYLQGEKDTRETMLDFQRRNTAALEQLQAQIERSRERIKRDPILLEHGRSDKDG